MNLSVVTVPLYDRSAEEAFAWLSAHGVDSVEIGTAASRERDTVMWRRCWRMRRSWKSIWNC